LEVYDKINLALVRAGYSPLTSTGSCRLVGSGAWHDAYRVDTDAAPPLVVRLRKQVIYGRKEAWNEQRLHEDYAPVGLYYAAANRCRPGICPAVYLYRIDPDLIFSLESYLPGSPLALQCLSKRSAVKIGEAIGVFLRAMHAAPTPLPGHGLLTWKEGQVVTSSLESWSDVWASRHAKMRCQLATLAGAPLEFDRNRVERKLEDALSRRQHSREPVVLANRDVSPENLLDRAGEWVGLVDPVPILENGTFYAAWFLHCYRLFLLLLGDAPRYAPHKFHKHADVLAAIADGFEAGYVQGERVLKLALHLDEFLWALDLAFESYELLQKGMTQEMRLRRGNEVSVQAALTCCLRTLEAWQQ
jgi:hypothetical protein